MPKLSGRAAVVTGGARGIGAAIARKLRAEGAGVMVTYLRGTREARALRREGITAVPVDVRSPAQVRRLFREVRSRFGRLDVLVNCASASIKDSYDRDIGKISPEELDLIWAVDVRGTFVCCKEAMPLLRASKGAIVNFSASAALQGDGTTLLYAAAKAGIDGFTRALARKVAPDVRVNAIAPGSVAAGSWLREWKLTPGDLKTFAKETPLARLAYPAEIAAAAAFLASEDASFVTGQTLIVDGGVYSK